MLFWNRVEIYRGNSLQEFSELKNALATADIKYEYKTKGTAEYILYVHQRDYEEAMYLTSNRHVR
ncbi:hypothetical protein HNQ56_002229 [Anaerotaenia torta]|uniref:hypothetical protein n=1 Tax=Anaerotaenia torta TaxID=433293 RepID=UPI003D1A1B3B